MKLTKNYGTRVTLHTRGGKYIDNIYDRFDNLTDVRNWVWSRYTNRGIVSVTVTQDWGYSKSFNMKTAKTK